MIYHNISPLTSINLHILICLPVPCPYVDISVSRAPKAGQKILLTISQKALDFIGSLGYNYIE